ncbi:MAG: STAS domain-containing protein [Phycisphaera sp.]|nr:STAS domain-containing protein [Phycisphaera sp.]
MSIEKWSETIWIARLGNEPALSEDLAGLYEDVRIFESPVHVVLDFSLVSHVNSSNLSQVLRLRKIAVDRETRLILASPRDGVWGVLLTTGLDKVFEHASDVTTALALIQV